MRIICTFLFCNLIAGGLHAQDLYLKTAIEESLKFSPVVQKSQAELNEAASKRLESYSGFLPMLSGDVNYLFAKKYSVIGIDINGEPATVPQIIPTSQFLLSASVPLFDGLSNINRFQASSQRYKAAQDDLSWTEFSTEMQTTLLFFKALEAKSLVDVAEQNVQTIDDHYKDVKALFKSGVVTRFDVLRVEVQEQEAQAELLKSQDEFEFAKIRLAKHMGKDFENRVPAGDFPMISLTILEKFSKDQNERKDLASLEEQKRAYSYLLKSDRSYWIPKISLIGQMQFYNNVNDDFTDWDSYRNAYNAGVNLHWNIFDSVKSISKSRETRAQYQGIQSTVREASLKANEDVEIWKRKFSYFHTLVDVKTIQTEKAFEAVRLARESVRAGAKTTTDLLDAELDLFKSRADILHAQMGMIEALIHLELATGQKVFEFHS